MAALWYAGVPEKQITTLSSRLLRMLGEPTGRVQPREVAIGLSPGEEAVTHLAEQEMIRLDDEYLGTEHLLLAMLRAGGDVAQLLADRGVTLESYEAGLAAVRRGDPPPASAVA
jgi:ATP-dependent Clp protease ATP-binding subunit ClpA